MVVGEGLLSAARFALRVVACGNALSLALESNLGRSFSSFPAWAEYLIADSFENSGAFESDGGGGRIRTFEVDDGRFTVCSLWPLGNPTTGHCLVLLACSLTREAGRIISNDAPL